MYIGFMEGRKILGSTPEECAKAMLERLPYGAMLSPMEFTVYPMKAGISVTAFVRDHEWHFAQGIGA